MKRLAKFVIDNLIKDVLTSAGSQIGESIGKRIGSKIYQAPEGESKDEDAQETDDKEQETDDRGEETGGTPGTSWVRRLAARD